MRKKTLELVNEALYTDVNFMHLDRYYWLCALTGNWGLLLTFQNLEGKITTNENLEWIGKLGKNRDEKCQQKINFSNLNIETKPLTNVRYNSWLF